MADFSYLPLVEQDLFVGWIERYCFFSDISRDTAETTECRRKEGLVECCFTSTETVGLLGTRAQDCHHHFHTAPEL